MLRQQNYAYAAAHQLQLRHDLAAINLSRLVVTPWAAGALASRVPELQPLALESVSYHVWQTCLFCHFSADT